MLQGRHFSHFGKERRHPSALQFLLCFPWCAFGICLRCPGYGDPRAVSGQQLVVADARAISPSTTVLGYISSHTHVPRYTVAFPPPVPFAATPPSQTYATVLHALVALRRNQIARTAPRPRRSIPMHHSPAICGGRQFLPGILLHVLCFLVHIYRAHASVLPPQVLHRSVSTVVRHAVPLHRPSLRSLPSPSSHDCSSPPRARRHLSKVRRRDELHLFGLFPLRVLLRPSPHRRGTTRQFVSSHTTDLVALQDWAAHSVQCDELGLLTPEKAAQYCADVDPASPPGDTAVVDDQSSSVNDLPSGVVADPARVARSLYADPLKGE